MASNRALGRGLAALIGERSQPGLQEIAVDGIVPSPHQPRHVFKQEELEELAESIRHLGVVQPIVVRPLAHGDEPEADEGAARYELIAGERRLRAAKLAGLQSIPAVIRDVDEISSIEIALAENVARQDLNGIEEAQAYAALADEFGLTHERIGGLVGRSRAAVSNAIRLLELPDDVQELVERGDLSDGHARALLGITGQDERRRLAREVVKQGLTVRQTEALVRRLNEPAAQKERPAADAAVEAYFADVTDELYGLFEAPVRIHSGARGGRLEIAFKDRAELERLLALLRGLQD
jgi:ParB family transcriptional regulator, chromosome partitioning protein